MPLDAGAPAQNPSAQAPSPSSSSSSLVLSVTAAYPPGTQAAAQNLSDALTSTPGALLQSVRNIAGPLSVSGLSTTQYPAALILLTPPCM